MIGPKIFNGLAKTQYSFTSTTNENSLTIVLTNGLYTSSHLKGIKVDGKENGSGKPDAIIALNAAIMSFPEWVPTIKALIQGGVKAIFTEYMEPSIDVVEKNLASVGSSLTTKASPNPFKQPINRYSIDNNFSAWSNGYYFGFN
jgi:hypothetical protein